MKVYRFGAYDWIAYITWALLPIVISLTATFSSWRCGANMHDVFLYEISPAVIFAVFWFFAVARVAYQITLTDAGDIIFLGILYHKTVQVSQISEIVLPAEICHNIRIASIRSHRQHARLFAPRARFIADMDGADDFLHAVNTMNTDIRVRESMFP